MNGADAQSRVTGGSHDGAANRRVRNLTLALTLLALTFYFGFIAITLYRSHH